MSMIWEKIPVGSNITIEHNLVASANPRPTCVSSMYFVLYDKAADALVGQNKDGSIGYIVPIANILSVSVSGDVLSALKDNVDFN